MGAENRQASRMLSAGTFGMDRSKRFLGPRASFGRPGVWLIHFCTLPVLWELVFCYFGNLFLVIFGPGGGEGGGEGGEGEGGEPRGTQCWFFAQFGDRKLKPLSWMGFRRAKGELKGPAMGKFRQEELYTTPNKYLFSIVVSFLNRGFPPPIFSVFLLKQVFL